MILAYKKKHLVNLQKFWDLTRPSPPPLWEKFPKKNVFLGGSVPYSLLASAVLSSTSKAFVWLCVLPVGVTPDHIRVVFVVVVLLLLLGLLDLLLLQQMANCRVLSSASKAFVWFCVLPVGVTPDHISCLSPIRIHTL